MNNFFSSLPLWQNNGIGIIRMLIGISLIYHGWEIFDTPTMNEYLKWDMFKDSSFSKFMVYGRKASELISGVLLLFGLFTRIACIILICTMVYIAFVVGNGKIWYQDQYPFLFAIIGSIFIFTGPGSFCLDKVVFKK